MARKPDDLTEFAVAGYEDKPNPHISTSACWYAHELGRRMRSAHGIPTDVRMGRGDSIWCAGVRWKFSENRRLEFTRAD